MRALLTNQGTAADETGLCYSCYPDEKNQKYAREMASRCDDIDPNSEFVDCTENDAIGCCICIAEVDNIVKEYKMTVTEALQLIEKNKGLLALNYCIIYASHALNMIEAKHTNELKGQLKYVLNNMTRWRQCKASTTTAMEIKECRAILKKASL